MKKLLKISILFFLICLIHRNSNSQQNTNGWYWVNSQPQANDINWIKIIDNSTYYAVGENGTFMKSTDGGDSWIINTKAGIPDNSFNSGGTLRLNTGWFFDANSGLVAGQSVSGDGGYVRRTTDGGMNFTSINLGISSGFARVYDMYFINSTTGYLCGNNTVKVFKTTDGGLTWNLMPNLPAASYTYNCVYAVDENNIYLGTSSDGVQRLIVKTSNGGANWIVQSLPGSTIVDIKDIEFQNSNTGYVCGNSVANNPSYFAYTTDGGNVWTEAIFPNKEHGLYDIEIAGSNVYTLGGNFNHYYTTTNLGVTWDSVYYGDPSNTNQPFDWFVYTFDISGSNVIVSGMYGKINLSNDNGVSWRNKNYSVGNNNATFSGIYAQPGTGNVWACGTNGLILYSSNSGANWAKQQTSAVQNFYDLRMLNSLTGYAVGGNLLNSVGFCYKTTNSGNNWVSLPIPTPTTPIYGLDFANANTGWIFGGFPFGYPAVISKTTNGGATWINQSTTPAFNGPMVSGDMIDANTGYCVGGGNVYKTVNGGTNWNKITTLPAGIGWSKVKTFTSSVLYLGGSNRIYKSYDGGNTWDSAFIPQSNFFNMDWVDLNNGTVVGTAGYTAKTSDGGLTWTERNPGSSTLTGVSMTNKDTVYAVCDRNVWGAIFRLYDNSSTLTTLNLRIGIEGFWNGTSQVSDTVRCRLRNSASPFSIADETTAVLNTQGLSLFSFDVASSGSYYMEITHRNSIETWSGLPMSIIKGGSHSYDFTLSASQAYGNNLALRSGRYCNYSGDVNQDGSVTLNDLLDTYNSSSNFLNGYVVTDVNGDNTVDLSDLTIVYNNSASFVAKVTP